MPHAQTSSPSYLLLSSLDAARAAAQVPGTSQHHPHLRAHPLHFWGLPLAFCRSQ